MTRRAFASLGIEPTSWGAAVAPALVRRVLRAYRLPAGGIHGPDHWLRVLLNGRTLAALTPYADLAVIEIFALVHDSCRIDEYEDHGHGARAAHLVGELAAEGLLALELDRVALLAAACARHELGEISPDPTIGCCWDADRLELSRLDIRPDSRFLSTAAALRADVQADAWARGVTNPSQNCKQGVAPRD